MERISMPRMQPKVRELLTKLREDAFLEIRAGYIDTGAAPNKDTAWKDPAQLKPETTTKEEVAAHKRRKKLLWVVPIPGTSNAPKKVETAKQPGDSAPAPAAGGADRPANSDAASAASATPPPANGSPAPVKQ
jgi:hypothetical protein